MLLGSKNNIVQVSILSINLSWSSSHGSKTSIAGELLSHSYLVTLIEQIYNRAEELGNQSLSYHFKRISVSYNARFFLIVYLGGPIKAALSNNFPLYVHILGNK